MKAFTSFSVIYPFLAVSSLWKSDVGVNVYYSANISLMIYIFLSTSADRIKKSISFCLVVDDCFFFCDDFLPLLALLDRFISY